MPILYRCARTLMACEAGVVLGNRCDESKESNRGHAANFYCGLKANRINVLSNIIWNDDDQTMLS